MPYLADDVSYRITETTPAIVGPTTFHDRIKDILGRVTSTEFAVDDTLVSPQRTRLYHVVGMFFLVDGKIVEWTDYVISES